MAMEKICFYNKFGHCKFQETCIRQHFREICELPGCETESCPKRHPRVCKFFENFNRCKFGSYCSFSHRTFESVLAAPENETKVNELKSRLDTLEEKARQSENEIKVLNEKIKNVEQRNVKLEKDFKTVLGSVKTTTELVVKEATDAVIKTITQQQDAIEKRSDDTLESLTNQLAMIFKLLQPQSSSQQPVRNEHKPKS